MAELIDPAAERYAAAHTTPLSGAAAAAAAWTAANTAAPGMMAGPVEARLLAGLVTLTGARNVLEIGSFTGVGALTLASGLRDGGQVTTLEFDPGNAATARRHIDASPWADRINLLVGDARQTLLTLPGPFDLVWIDAWKADYPAYWELIVAKLAPGAVVAADNIFRGGLVLDPDADDPGTAGVRRFADAVQADPDFDNVLLSIGDGVLLAWHRLGA